MVYDEGPRAKANSKIRRTKWILRAGKTILADRIWMGSVTADDDSQFDDP